MRSLLLSLLLMLGLVSAESQIITATLTITNTAGTTNGETLLVGSGIQRTFSNSVPNGLLWIQYGTNIYQATTNIYNSYVANRAASTVLFAPTTTNSITWQGFPGAALAITISSGWGTVSYSTNTLTNATAVRIPASIEGTAMRQYIGSELVNYINQSSNGLSGTATAAFVGTAGTQTITGAKTFSAATLSGNTLLAGQLLGSTAGYIVLTGSTNSKIPYLYVSTYLGLTNCNVYGGTFFSPVFSNSVNYGTAFSSPGAGITDLSEQFGFGALASAVNSTAIGNNAAASGNGAVAAGGFAAASDFRAVSVGTSSIASGRSSVAIGDSSDAAATNAVAIGKSSYAPYNDSIAIGKSATTTATNQIVLGGVLAPTVVIPGAVLAGSISNANLTGLTTNNSSWSWLRTNNSGLANGNNANVQIGQATDVFVSGPTGAFTINGIAAPSNTDSSHTLGLWIWNRTGQNMTIANESGVDPTAANRIQTAIGANIIVTNNPGIVHLRYDSVAQRWGVF